MGKPRLLVLIRHAQSEGNKNREIHQLIPDHRVKLTEDGHRQAEEAGRRLRHLLKPDDTLQIFTSPYRRTRETTEGLLKTLTARDDPDDPDAAPSPFSRSKITVYEEPRLREQDFGNFQPCSAEMERMWQERADYGHFFYRIPNGESAADAYDRVSGFNESLWRQFGDDDFPSVCVLVTHGLMTRVFLMKWYHWSVEYFEDLRNVNHCEFIVMQKNLESGKYLLDNQLRTWSELKRQRAEQARNLNPIRRNTLSNFLTKKSDSPNIPPRKWGGCVEGCNHQNCSRGEQKKGAEELALPPAAGVPEPAIPVRNEGDDHALAREEPVVVTAPGGSSTLSSRSSASVASARELPVRSAAQRHLVANALGNSSDTDAGTPHERSDSDDYFDVQNNRTTRPAAMAHAMRRAPQRKATPEDIERWVNESGMGRGKHADALGDEPAEEFTDESREGGMSKVVKGKLESIDEAEARDKSLSGSVY